MNEETFKITTSDTVSECGSAGSYIGVVYYTKYFCCDNFEPQEGKCRECDIGFTSKVGRRCNPCPENSYGLKCAGNCYCQRNESCNNVKGCVNSKTFTGDNTEITTKIAIISLASGSMVLLLLICLVIICWKYKMSRRNHDPTIMVDPRILIREGINQSEQVEMHEYEEIIDDIISQVSSINSGKDQSGNLIYITKKDCYKLINSSKSDQSDSTYRKEYFCCKNYEHINGTCIGFTSKQEEPCKPCTSPKYGKKCSETCVCELNHRCNNVLGCIQDDTARKGVEGNSFTLLPDITLQIEDIVTETANTVFVYTVCTGSLALAMVLVSSTLTYYRKEKCKRNKSQKKIQCGENKGKSTIMIV
ncbi:unnamed protein product [Mytilus edulis]|uniref:Uncharacterized protein n=1 Tax=Mytilus edulis TaxID=6550 RepID=A0A8S3QWN6_MYTED|nr:unnamed protein product [Mytilus edulis]